MTQKHKYYTTKYTTNITYLRCLPKRTLNYSDVAKLNKLRLPVAGTVTVQRSTPKYIFINSVDTDSTEPAVRLIAHC